MYLGKAKKYNSAIVIENCNDKLLEFLRKELSYDDEAIKFQLKKMEKSPWSKASARFQALAKSVTNCLVTETNGVISTPPGFAYLIEDKIEVEDLTTEKIGEVSYPYRSREAIPTFRPYQQEAIDLCSSRKNGLICMGTGLGKSLTMLGLIKKLKLRTLIIVPSINICNQLYDDFNDRLAGRKVGKIQGKTVKPEEITVAVIQSALNNIDVIKGKFDLLIIDECHHLAAKTLYLLSEKLADIPYKYAFTATNYRSDGKDILINSYFGPTILNYDAKWGIENKWLAKPLFIIKKVKTRTNNKYKARKGVKIEEDKLENYNKHILYNDEFNETAIADIEKMRKTGKSMLILVNQIEHGQMLADHFKCDFANGSDKNSTELVDKLNTNKIQMLIGTSVVGEGTNTKNIDVLFLLNFYASKGPVIQSVGRALRKTESKDTAIIIDYILEDSNMLKRHAYQRIAYYRQITNDVRIL